MIFITIVLFTFTFPSSFESSKKLLTKDFCKSIGENCVGNECSYYEKCPTAFAFKCGQNKCAREKSDCLAYLKAESFYNSDYFKKKSLYNALFGTFRKPLRKREIAFQKFQGKIDQCIYPAYAWNSSDVCLVPKLCYEKVLKPTKSLINWLVNKKEYKLNRIDCPCELSHDYQCQNQFCTTSKRACNVFIEEKQKDSTESNVQICQYRNN
jgi:hypothetical protein